MVERFLKFAICHLPSSVAWRGAAVGSSTVLGGIMSLTNRTDWLFTFLFRAVHYYDLKSPRGWGQFQPELFTQGIGQRFCVWMLPLLCFPFQLEIITIGQMGFIQHRLPQQAFQTPRQRTQRPAYGLNSAGTRTGRRTSSGNRECELLGVWILCVQKIDVHLP